MPLHRFNGTSAGVSIVRRRWPKTASDLRMHLIRPFGPSTSFWGDFNLVRGDWGQRCSARVFGGSAAVWRDRSGPRFGGPSVDLAARTQVWQMQAAGSQIDRHPCQLSSRATSIAAAVATSASSTAALPEPSLPGDPDVDRCLVDALLSDKLIRDNLGCGVALARRGFEMLVRKVEATTVASTGSVPSRRLGGSQRRLPYRGSPGTSQPPRCPTTPDSVPPTARRCSLLR